MKVILSIEAQMLLRLRVRPSCFWNEAKSTGMFLAQQTEA